MGVSASVDQELGKRIAELRRAAGLTQADLAQRTDVAPETISRLERGTAIPSLARIEVVARVLGVELRDLFSFRRKVTDRQRALEKLLAVVRKRSTEDIELVADLAERVFRRME